MSRTQRAETATTPAAVPPVSVTWRGTTFALPTAADFPLAAIEAEEDGKHLTALRLILGQDQYGAWRSLATTAADAEEFSTLVMTELGTGNH